VRSSRRLNILLEKIAFQMVIMIKMRRMPAQRRIMSPVSDLMGGNPWLWLTLIFGAAVINAGTAVLRLGSFFPFPQAVDFSGYYAAAWSTRMKISFYPWSEDLLKFLTGTQGLPWTPPLFTSTPLWAWLMQPATMFTFPFAASLWLLLELALAVYCHVLLVRIAGYRGWKVTALTLPVTLTFGPLFLSLTLGQNVICLLLSALLLGASLKSGSGPGRWFFALPVWVAAVAGKIFPALWAGSLILMRRWRTFAIAVALLIASFGVLAFFEPERNIHFWSRFVPNQTREFAAASIGIDDQSINAFLARVGTSHTFEVSGLNVRDKHQVTWTFPWNLSHRAIQAVSAALILVFAALLLFSWIRNNYRDAEGMLYALVLLSLLLFPHVERYNHALALPAMAWLWRLRPPYRNLTVIAYGMFGLSRLNHLWVLLPSPLGPLASGFGLAGVLILFLGLAHSLVSLKTGPQTAAIR